MRSVRAVLCIVLCAGWGLEAQADQGLELPWSPTPANPIAVLPQGGTPALTLSLGAASPGGVALRAVSARASGWPAVLWAEGDPMPHPLALDAAERQAMEVARSIAEKLGVSADDFFVLGSTPLSLPADPFVVVTLGQRWRGVPVRGGGLVFTFVGGNLASIRNDLAYPDLADVSAAISPARAVELAVSAARGVWPDARAVDGEGELEVWVPSEVPGDARLALRVAVESAESRPVFHVDARTGAVLAADDAVLYGNGDGRVRLVVDAVSPREAPEPVVARALLAGMGATDADGEASFPAPVEGTYDGPGAKIIDQSGRPLERLMIPFGGPYRVIDVRPSLLDQADPFIAFHRVREYARSLSPDVPWLRQKIEINVNVVRSDACNANWDGRALNFYPASMGCVASGRVASVVYHEFGHGYHQALIPSGVFDGAVSEGAGDFLASLMTGDSAIGRGLLNDGTALRQLDQPRVYPTALDGNVHHDGLIWASALWDLRVALETKYGAIQGRRAVARLFVRALAQNPKLTTAYPAAIAGDDDDATLGNGTPNSCEINRVFAAHGLVNGGGLAHARAPERAYVAISHQAPGRFSVGPGGVLIEARVENRSSCGTFDPSTLRVFVAPGLQGGTFAPTSMSREGDRAVARIADLRAGDSFRYYFEARADGATFREGSEASPHVGRVIEIDRVSAIEEGFEAGFGGFRHGTIDSDRTDDWEVGAPLGLAGDPDAAHGGTSVAGTDLGSGGGASGTDGIAKRSTFLESPPISIEGLVSPRLELWHQFAINGTLRIRVDGVEVWSKQDDGTHPSGGWRFLSIPIVPAVQGRADVVVRFESEASALNGSGGWSLDDVAVTGIGSRPAVTSPTDSLGGAVGQGPVGGSLKDGGPLNELGGGCACTSGASAAPGGDATSLSLSAFLCTLALLRRRRVAREMSVLP